jgi:hypothetical protein
LLTKPKGTVPSELREAILESIFWREDDTQPGIDLRLQYHGQMVTAALVASPGQKQVYQDLYWALRRGLGRTLAEIETFEVAW